MRCSLFAVAIVSCSLSSALTARAADFYVDPAGGSANGNGSAANPWKTLQEVVDAGLFGSTVKAGDTVHLLSGYHGEMMVSGGSYAPPISVVAAAGHSPQLRRVRFSNTSGWLLRGVSVSPSHGGAASGAITLVEIQTSSSKITVEDSLVFSVSDSSAWGVSEWLGAHSGFSVRGPESVVRGNTVKNVRFGISADAAQVMIDGNTVENFSADGLRGLGDDQTFQYNLVKNSYLDDSLDSNHDDGFQSWSVGPGGVGTGEVKNMVLRGNVIINWEDPAQPLKGTLQGIGCFDGTFVGWVVENNVVITNHWHGISLYGARDSRIVNNTVIDVQSGQPGPPWIMVNDHKNSTPSENVVVRNNLSTNYDLKGTNVTSDHNVTLSGSLDAYFVAPTAPAWNLRLLETSPAVDQGSTTLAPALDADKIPRPQGAGVDLGAYEWHDPSVVPSGGTGGGAGASSGGSSSGGTSSGGAPSGGTSGGGAGGTTSGGASSGGAAANGDGGDDGGCGCRVAGAEHTRRASLLLVALGAALTLRRRRRR